MALEKKGRWAKCGGPSSLAFFQFIFLLVTLFFLFSPDLPSCGAIGEGKGKIQPRSDKVAGGGKYLSG